MLIPQTLKPINSALLSSFEQNAQNTALAYGNQHFSYQQMLMAAYNFATRLQLFTRPQQCPIAIYSTKTADTYLCILACILTGHSYLPINNKNSNARIEFILNESQCQLLLCASTANVQLGNRIQALGLSVSVASPHTLDWEFIGHASQITECAQSLHKTLNHLTATDIAYIMYTSGSTGNPKGVPISHNNLAHYLQNISSIVKINSRDHCTQLFDISFDLSVHDIFITWLNGACLCIPTTTDALAPASYINKHAISVWFSVPSTIDMLQRLKLLKTNAFPSIRLSLFCGEALAGKTLEHWADACPNSQCINLYGPTEATIACFSYNIKAPHNNQPATIPIGLPFGNNTACLQAGELQLGGPQLTQGYINNPNKNNAAFYENNGQRWYKSGDNAEYKNACYYHLGRSDDQVKINGFRIELQEITHCLKKHAAHLNMRAMAWPLNTPGEPPSLYLFIEGEKNTQTEESIKLTAKRHLADYMRPKHIVWIAALPLNSNGKIDKKQLVEFLNQKNHE